MPRRAVLAVVAALSVLASLAVMAAPAASANPLPSGMPSLTGGPPLGPGDPIGALLAVGYPDGQARFVGWAADPDDLTANVSVFVLEDGRPLKAVQPVATAVARPKVTARYGTGATPGFDISAPIPVLGQHSLCVAVKNRAGRGVDTVLGCVTTPAGSADEAAAHSPFGAVESVTATRTSGTHPTSTVTVTGWASEPDYHARPVTVVAYLDGTSMRTLAAKRNRPDVAAANPGVYRKSGFSTTITAAAGAHNVCVWAVNVGPGANTLLGCKAIDTRGVRSRKAPVVDPAVNAKIVAEVRKHVGQPYVWAATGPKAFDCSGLVQYAYRQAGVSTPRIADDQFRAAHLISANRVVPGDLVFYRDGTGEVYHVGVYLGPGITIAAVDPAHGVTEQHIWDSQVVSYGSFTHR